MKYNLVFDSMLEKEFTSEKEFEKYCLELKEKETDLLKNNNYDFLFIN